MTDNDIKTISEKIDSLHKKILESKFSEKVTESEMVSLILAVQELNRQKAEIERLQKILVGFMDEVGTWSNKYDVDISNIHKLPLLAKEDWNIRNKIKAEAIKEFVERLKVMKHNKQILRLPLLDLDIDNLVKEMVGEQDG